MLQEPLKTMNHDIPAPLLNAPHKLNCLNDAQDADSSFDDTVMDKGLSYVGVQM